MHTFTSIHPWPIKQGCQVNIQILHGLYVLIYLNSLHKNFNSCLYSNLKYIFSSNLHGSQIKVACWIHPKELCMIDDTLLIYMHTSNNSTKVCRQRGHWGLWISELSIPKIPFNFAICCQWKWQVDQIWQAAMIRGG